MNEPRVRFFFFGSYMNPAVLREVGLVPERLEVARLDGHDIRIAPRANLVPSCYVSPSKAPQPADPAYVERIVKPARDLGFPAWYIERLESEGEGRYETRNAASGYTDRYAARRSVAFCNAPGLFA
jgi:hypothetical protein